jgi:hypothetical protein
MSGSAPGCTVSLGVKERRPMFRALIPPLTIALALVTAGALLLTAAAMAPPPLTSRVASPSPVASASEAALPDASVTALVQAPHAELPLPPTVVALARLTYAPGASGPSRALPGPLLLAVEVGSLAVQIDGSGQLLGANRATVIAADAVTLHVGDGLVLPTATTAAFRNDGSVPVVALAAGVFPTHAVLNGPARLGASPDRMGSARWIDDGAPGITVQPLVGGWVVDLAAGSAALTLRRVNLQSGDSASLTAPGPVALAVETGALTLSAGGGLIWVQHPNGSDEWIAPTSAATLLSGDGALLQAGATATLRNAGSGPLLILELTVGLPTNATVQLTSWRAPDDTRETDAAATPRSGHEPEGQS